MGCRGTVRTRPPFPLIVIACSRMARLAVAVSMRKHSWMRRAAYTYGTIRVDASSRGIHQTFYTAVDPAGVIHRVLSYESESWGPWEWENPPLIVGKEYQTTKRYNGAVVFQKLVNLGKAIDGAEIEVVSENYRINKISHAKGNPGLFPICQWDIRPELREWDFAIACDGRRIKIYAGDRATESSGNYVNVFVEYHRA